MTYSQGNKHPTINDGLQNKLCSIPVSLPSRCTLKKNFERGATIDVPRYGHIILQACDLASEEQPINHIQWPIRDSINVLFWLRVENSNK